MSSSPIGVRSKIMSDPIATKPSLTSSPHSRPCVQTPQNWGTTCSGKARQGADEKSDEPADYPVGNRKRAPVSREQGRLTSMVSSGIGVIPHSLAGYRISVPIHVSNGNELRCDCNPFLVRWIQPALPTSPQHPCFALHFARRNS